MLGDTSWLLYLGPTIYYKLFCQFVVLYFVNNIVLLILLFLLISMKH